jgi:hypothetical protein
MAKQTFSVGQVLTAAQMTSLQQTAMGGGSATAKTASYTLVAADAGTVVSVNSTSATTITVNTGLFAAGDTVTIQNLNTGISTITAGTATVNTSSSLALAQYEGGELYFVSASSAIFFKSDGAAAGGGNTEYTLLNSGGTTLVGSSTLTVSITAYNKLFIAVEGATSQANAFTHLRFNADTGSNYYSYITYITGYSTPSYNIANGADSKFILGRMNDSETTFFNAGIKVDGAKSSGQKIISFNANNTQQSANNDARWGQGRYFGTSQITSVSIITTNGPFAAGTLFIYGAN